MWLAIGIGIGIILALTAVGIFVARFFVGVGHEIKNEGDNTA